MKEWDGCGTSGSSALLSALSFFQDCRVVTESISGHGMAVFFAPLSLSVSVCLSMCNVVVLSWRWEQFSSVGCRKLSWFNHNHSKPDLA